MATIELLVRDKMAQNLKPREQRIVCDNSDYVIAFDFDDEWTAYPEKTARFSYGRAYQDIVFTGNKVVAPVMRNVSSVHVGVFAGNLHTTTPALIYCDKSIRGFGCSPEAPAPNVYDEIMERVNTAVTTAENVQRMAESGELDGFSPTIDVMEIDNGHRVTVTDANGEKSFDVKNGSGGGGGGGTDLQPGENIEIKNGKISVITTDKIEEDNTRPITSAAVHATVGNIDVVLETI